MTRLSMLIQSYRRTSLLVGAGIGLFFFTWAMTPVTLDDTSRLSIFEEVVHASDKGVTAKANTRVVGFGHVDVQGGTVPLSSSIGGQVEEILIAEGDHAKAGQPLVRLSGIQARSQLIEAQAAVEQARVQRRQADRAIEHFNIRKQLQSQAISLAKTKLEAGRRDVQHVTQLAGDDVVPNEKLLSSRDLVKGLESSLEAEELKLKELELQDPRETVELASASLRLAEAKLAQAEEFLNRHTIVAPSDGTILRVQLTAGQLTGPNQMIPAIWFAPDKPRIVRCEIDQAFADRVQVGMKAEVFDDRVAGQRWTGYVQRCGDWIAQRRSLLDEPFQKNDVRTLETIITLDPGQPEVRIGQRMRVVLTNEPVDKIHVQARR